MADSDRSADLTTLRRGLQVLELLRSANPTSSLWSNQQISDSLGLSKSLVSRTLKGLVELGFVERSPDGRTFAPGLRTYPIGARSVDQDLLRAGATVVREVVRLTQARVYLSVRNGMEAMTLWSDQPVSARPRVHSIGTTFPLGVSEAGRALLIASTDVDISTVADEMRRIGIGHADQLADQIARDRRSGFSWRRAEERGIAVPVSSSTGGGVIGALGAASASLSTREVAESTARLLVSAAENLARRLVAASQSAAAPPLPFSGWPQMPTDMFPAPAHRDDAFPEFLGE